MANIQQVPLPHGRSRPVINDRCLPSCPSLPVAASDGVSERDHLSQGPDRTDGLHRAKGKQPDKVADLILELEEGIERMVERIRSERDCDWLAILQAIVPRIFSFIQENGRDLQECKCGLECLPPTVLNAYK